MHAAVLVAACASCASSRTVCCTASRWSGWGCHQSVSSRTQRHLRARPPGPRRTQVHRCLSSQPPMLPRARASRAPHAPRLRCASRALYAPRLRRGAHTAPPPIHPPVQVHRCLSSQPPTLPRRSFPRRREGCCGTRQLSTAQSGYPAQPALRLIARSCASRAPRASRLRCHARCQVVAARAVLFHRRRRVFGHVCV